MTAEEALESLIAALPLDFEDQGEIGILYRAVECQDKLDRIRELSSGVSPSEEQNEDIWAAN